MTLYIVRKIYPEYVMSQKLPLCDKKIKIRFTPKNKI